MTQKLILHKPLGFVDILSYVYIRNTIVNEYCKQKIHLTHTYTYTYKNTNNTRTLHRACGLDGGLGDGGGMAGMIVVGSTNFL